MGSDTAVAGRVGVNWRQATVEEKAHARGSKRGPIVGAGRGFGACGWTGSVSERRHRIYAQLFEELSQQRW